MPDQSKTALVLVPHPDDAEYYAGGFISKLASEGWRVVIVIATDGRKGTFQEAEDDLIQKRALEAAIGAQIMGAETPIMLGHPDGSLDTLPAGVLREQFIRLIRYYQPLLTISQDPFYALETHPDHRACAWAAVEAIQTAYLPLIYPDHSVDGLKPHGIPEKYLYTAPGSPRANRVIDISQTMDIKIVAMQAHHTQMTFFIDEMLIQAKDAGLDPEPLLASFGGSYGEAVGWSMRNEDSETGKPAGFEYGEAYHYDRFHPIIEQILAQHTHS